VRWIVCPRSTDLPIVVLVVDDGDDHDLAAVLAQNHVPNNGFRGEWGAGQGNGRWLVGFRLVMPVDCFARLLITDVRRELLEAIIDVPHIVAIVAQATAGDASTAAAIALRLGGSLTVEVAHRSAHVARRLAPRGTN